jgi:hypothetical protein
MKLEAHGLLDPETKAALEASAANSLPREALPADAILAMRAGYAYERRFWNEVSVDLAGVEELSLPAGLATRPCWVLPAGRSSSRPTTACSTASCI